MQTADYVTAEKPLSWLKAMDSLAATGRAHLALAEANRVCASSGVPEGEVEALLRFLGEMGVLLWVEEQGLRDVVILDPIQFFVQPATMVICKHQPTSDDPTHHHLPEHRACALYHHEEWLELTERAVLCQALVPVLFAKHSEAVQETLVRLMVKFGLIVPLNQSPGTGAGAGAGAGYEKRYLVPALLPPRPSSLRFVPFRPQTGQPSSASASAAAVSTC